MPKIEKAAKAAKLEEAKAAAPKTAQPKAAMPKETKIQAAKAAKVAAPDLARTTATRSAAPKASKAALPESPAPKPAKVVQKKPSIPRKAAKSKAAPEKAQLLSSEVAYQGPLFRVLHDRLIEPNGKEVSRDVIRHNGSVVILAVDNGKNKKNPWIVVERQYRHAANQYLWELPAGKLDPGEDAVTGAKRELAEETGYQARKWKPLVEYYASPGFLGESMKVFLAEGLIAGDAHPEADEQIEFRLVKLSDVIKMIEKGAILDGKTLTSVLLYARVLAGKRKK
jgi:ADP-ribose pyrophosphatase